MKLAVILNRNLVYRAASISQGINTQWGLILEVQVLELSNLHLSNDREDSSELLVDHKAKDSHHGGTSVVELNGTLAELGLLIEGVPSEVEGSVTEVTNEFTLSGDVLHNTELKSTDEAKIWATPAPEMASGPEMAARPLGKESKA